MNSERKAVYAILIAGVFNALVGAGFYFAYQREPQISALSGVYVRIVCNLVLVPLSWVSGRQAIRLSALFEPPLWIWGLFGVLSLGTYYLALLRMGAGMTMFLNTGSGLFIASLSPWIAGQKIDKIHFIAISGCLMGMSLIAGPSLSSHLSVQDVTLGIASGLFAAIAYLMVARTRSRYTTDTLLLGWTLMNLIVMGLVMSFLPTHWPTKIETWMVLLFSGLGAAGSQYFTAAAYQLGKASVVACLSFLGPLLCVLVDRWLFGVTILPTAWLGIGIVSLCGMVLPFLKRPARRVPLHLIRPQASNVAEFPKPKPAIDLTDQHALDRAAP